jgi:hypothetical protein
MVSLNYVLRKLQYMHLEPHVQELDRVIIVYYHFVHPVQYPSEGLLVVYTPYIVVSRTGRAAS